MQGHSRGAASANPSDPSQLLSALAQCNDSVWQSHLVPMLDAYDSLPNLALSCKQLRVLCHSTADTLRLSCNRTQQHQQQLEQLPAWLPACTTVEYIATEQQDVSHLAQLLPVLSRLPRLRCLDLQATTSPSSAAPIMTLALELLHLRLPNLRQVVVSLCGGWGDNAQPWKALGAASQLTRLELYSNADVPAQLNIGHLSALSGLHSSLRALVVSAEQLVVPEGLQQQPQPFQQDYGFLSALTGLTQLWLPLPPSAVNLTAISACRDLQNLSLSAIEDEGGVPELEGEDWDALACLVQLTELRLAKVAGTGSSESFLGALRQLQELRVLRADGLIPATALPVLARLPKLQDLGCYWAAGGEPAAAAVVLPQHHLTGLLSLGAGWQAPIPWAAFPQLRTVMQWDTWDAASFAGMCKHCTKLRELGSDWTSVTTSLPPGEPAAQRAAAVAGLAGLAHLTQLHFSANDDAEIAALAAVTQLQEVIFMVPHLNLRTQACGPMSLTPLVLLRSLRQLVLWLPGLPLTAEDARRLMSSMQCIPSVSLVVHPSVQPAVLQAYEQARADNMKIPDEVTISASAAWVNCSLLEV